MSSRSAYRRSKGVGRRSRDGTPVKLSAELRVQREAEREKLKRCNNRLVNYIDKVHDLELANALLASENEKLRRREKTPETDVGALYEDELKRLREKVEQLQTENARMEIERDNLEYELDDTKDKLKHETEEKVELEKEVKDLRKDVDDATIERVNLETKVENLQEELQLEKQAHAIEVENLRSQIQPVHASVVASEQSSMIPDLNEAIQDFRKQQESFSAKSLEDLDAYYKEKVENLTKQLRASQDECKHLRGEVGDQRKKIHQLEMELEALRGRNDGLEKQVQDLEDMIAKNDKENHDRICELEKDLDNAKEDLGKYLKDYQALNNLKLSLEQEIAIYHKLLCGEEERIQDVEVADPQSVIKSRGRSRSRSHSSASEKAKSKSRSRSRSKSPAKSRSRSRSSHSSASSKSVSDIVEEMLEEKKGVMSVTWKVKGGTVRPVEPFTPNDDAEALRSAMKGFGTDEKAVINILGARSSAQRQTIAAAYKSKFDRELLDDLKSELNDKCKSTALHLMWKKSVLDANALRKAVKGLGTDEAVLMEVLCTQSSREIEDIKADYEREFGRDLINDVASETKGAFSKLLLAVLEAKRPADNGTVVANLAEQDAQSLLDLGVKNWNPSDPKFLEIFTKRSFEHLWFLFNECWKKVAPDQNIIEFIDKECHGDLKRGLKTLVRFSTFVPPVYYAIQLFEAMKGFGTEDNQIIYIITTRSEIDMIDTKEEFGKLFKVTLASRIEKETSGEYKNFLLKLIGEDGN